ncbi:hypothetical protein FG386_003111 [Cryptosporidium ryanae]|uniref:uncharacterized protein n=1 Tax=Cryptosporidium ryanae TaxID=515981 RepID=UPI00351A4492|nr:hypothetical protein FG386_003111 [Cryptosporidium ryanae]
MNNNLEKNKTEGYGYEELCVNALNSVNRPPEIDEPFFGIFKSKPKLKIIPRDNYLRNSGGTNKKSVNDDNGVIECKDEFIRNVDKKTRHLSNSMKAKKDEVSVIDKNILKFDKKEKSETAKSLRRVKSDNDEEVYRKDIVDYIDQSNMLKTVHRNSLNKTSSETRKRKITNLTSKARDEFLTVITPISPYVISPKNNTCNYSKNNNNMDLTERNIDMLKSLIEIKDKELSNLNANYSYEKSEYKLEIIHLKEKIKEYEESCLALNKDIVLKDEIIESLKDSINKLESEYISARESLEIMLEAEKNANLSLKQELKEKNALLNSFGCTGLNILSEEGIIIEQKNYKYKYFDAVSKLQRLETELVLLKNSEKQSASNIINNLLPPIFIGESSVVRENKDVKNLCLSLREVNINIVGKISDTDIQNSREEIFKLVSENRFLFQDNIKLREELELEKNKNIVANIRSLTQRPITISSCIGTRLSLSDIELFEYNSKLYEESKRISDFFVVDEKNVCVNINSKNKFVNMNIIKLNCINITSCINYNYYSSSVCRSTQTIVGKEIEHNNTDEINKSSELIKELTVIVEVKDNLNGSNCYEDDSNDDIKLNYYKLAFENYDFVPKISLEDKSKVKDNSKKNINSCKGSNCKENITIFTEDLNINNKNSKFKNSDKIQEIRRTTFELNHKLKEIKNIVLKYLVVPPNLINIVSNMVHNRNINTSDTQIENIIYKDNILYNISILFSRLYKNYVDSVNKMDRSLIIQNKEYDVNLSRFESQIHKMAQEKVVLLDEIKKLREIIELNELEKSNTFVQNKNKTDNHLIKNEVNLNKNANINEFYGKEDIMSCYTFGDNSSINLENELELSVDNLNNMANFSDVINNRINTNKNNLVKTEMEIIKESKCSMETKISSDSDRIDKIIKLQGRIRSFRQNSNFENNICKSISNFMPVNNVSIEDIFDKTDISLKLDFDENINFNDEGLVIYNQFSSKILSKEELKDMKGTSIILRLYRYYKQSRELEKQVVKLTKEKQKLELDYEKDAQKVQMDLLSSKLIIKARDAEVSALKDKCEYLSSRMEEDINNIKLASREEIEKVWKPKVDDLNVKCDDYRFKITSLESEMTILRQQLSFQKQIHSKKFGIKNNLNSSKTSVADIKPIERIYNYKIIKNLRLPVQSINSDKSNEQEKIVDSYLNLGDYIDSSNYSSVEDQNLEVTNSNSSDQDENDNNNNKYLHNLKSALTKLKTASSSYS